MFTSPEGVDLSRFGEAKPPPPEVSDFGLAYPHQAEMGLIPLVPSLPTDSISPFRMCECLTCAPHLQPPTELQAARAAVLFADDLGSYLSSIDLALAATDDMRRFLGRYAAQHTWESGHEKLDATLDRLLT